MDEDRPYPGTQLFTLHLWAENVGESAAPQREWRGQVCHVASGTQRYFCGWPACLALLQDLTAALDSGGLPATNYTSDATTRADG